MLKMSLARQHLIGLYIMCLDWIRFSGCPAYWTVAKLTIQFNISKKSLPFKFTGCDFHFNDAVQIESSQGHCHNKVADLN